MEPNNIYSSFSSYSNINGDERMFSHKYKNDNGYPKEAYYKGRKNNNKSREELGISVNGGDFDIKRYKNNSVDRGDYTREIENSKQRQNRNDLGLIPYTNKNSYQRPDTFGRINSPISSNIFQTSLDGGSIFPLIKKDISIPLSTFNLPNIFESKDSFFNKDPFDDPFFNDF